MKRARIDTTTTSLHTIQQTYRATRETAASSAKQIGQDVSTLLSNVRFLWLLRCGAVLTFPDTDGPGRESDFLPPFRYQNRGRRDPSRWQESRRGLGARWAQQQRASPAKLQLYSVVATHRRPRHLAATSSTQRPLRSFRSHSRYRLWAERCAAR